MLAVLAEFEKDQISERTKLAMSHKKANGERVGTVPFGYDLGDNGRLVENASEQAAISLIRELRSRGLTYRFIASELESRGYKSKKGASKWSHTTVKSILDRLAA